MADEPGTLTNPYQAPRADLSVEAPVPASDLTFDEVHAYVGAKRAAYFWNQWKPAMASGSLFAGFSFAAGFFNFLWFLYRKMYLEFAITLVVLLIVGELTTSLSGVRSLDKVVRLASIAVVGSIGVGLYLRRARRVIVRARQAEPDLERRLALLREKGGTSILWPLVVAALQIAVAILTRFTDAAD